MYQNLSPNRSDSSSCKRGRQIAPALVNAVIARPGRPLDPDSQRFFSERFGHDFSQVRLHADQEAATSAQAVDAHAYAVGNHVVFGAGRYAPETPGGQYLLAHELAHTLQQGDLRDRPSAPLGINAPGDAYELAADRFAFAAMQARTSNGTTTERVPMPATSAPFVARIDCATVPQNMCKGIYSCGHGGSGKCYWGGTYPNKRCMCFGASRPDTSTSQVLKALLILGLSVLLLATVIAALLDPEPVTKLAAAGLSMAEAVALLLLLGYSREEVREMGLDPDLVAQVDMGEPPEGGDTRVA
jgi:hypothetical protein